MTTATSAVGLARLPTALKSLLDEAATIAETAARLLHALAREPRAAPRLIEEIADCERAGDRITHDLHRELQDRLALGEGRPHVLRLAAALDDVTDAVDEAAHALSVFADAVPHDRAATLVAILRDLVRASMREVRGIEGPLEQRESSHQRAEALRDEFRQELRTTTAAALSAGPGPIEALRATTLLRRLRAVSDAAAALSVAVRGLATILN
jgi:uncharacterized protein Yka (UPF0111/DUF47 family)